MVPLPCSEHQPSRSLTGFIMNNRKTLAMATPGTDIETQTIYSSDGSVLQVLQRICHGSRVLTQMKSKRSDD